MTTKPEPTKPGGLRHWLKSNWLLLLFGGGLLSAFIFLRSSPTEFSSPDQLDQRLVNGQPTIIEFYSNF